MILRVYAVSDTVKKGGGGKKSTTAAKKRKPRKPKVQTVDEWAEGLPF